MIIIRSVIMMASHAKPAHKACMTYDRFQQIYTCAKDAAAHITSSIGMHTHGEDTDAEG